MSTNPSASSSATPRIRQVRHWRAVPASNATIRAQGFQVSSDAAAALGMLAGAPAEQLNVTALRREEAQPAEDTAAATGTGDIEPASGSAASDLDPVAGAAAAIDAAETESAGATRPVLRQGRNRRRSRREASHRLPSPISRSGIFSVEQNAKQHRHGDATERAWCPPCKKQSSRRARRFWRVIVGPPRVPLPNAHASCARKKGIGFSDAYPVTN